jgi:hypothetical protein
MANDVKSADLMDYQALQAAAMLGVVRAALGRAAEPRGLPGDHHFYISFRSGAPGVSIPPDLRERYPDEMTIVLQNQFWDLLAEDNLFSVTLQFGGKPKSLVIPYAAITRFYDPSVQFLMQFEVPEAPATPEPPPPAEANGEDEGPKIVSLDQFRKK